MAKVERLTNDDDTYVVYLIWSPADNQHIGFDSRWEFNGDYEKPTFTPSMLVTTPGKPRSHFFVTDGKIQYLSDCEHEYAGQILDLEECDF